MKAIITKYISPSNTLCSRVKASDGHACHITIPFDHSCDYEDAFKKAAQALIEKMSWKVKFTGSGALGDDYVFTLTDAR